jgi:hypothetical protein
MLYNLEEVPSINLNNEIPQEVPVLNSTDLATPIKLTNNVFSTELKSLRNHIAYYENAVLEGIALGARATLKALDEIYEEALADL